MKKSPSPEALNYLQDNFRYDPKTGDIWRKVGSCLNNGYQQVVFTLDSHQYVLMGHNVAWFLKTGEYPVDYRITHKNERTDNSFKNLTKKIPWNKQ